MIHSTSGRHDGHVSDSNRGQVVPRCRCPRRATHGRRRGRGRHSVSGSSLTLRIWSTRPSRPSGTMKASLATEPRLWSMNTTAVSSWSGGTRTPTITSSPSPSTWTISTAPVTVVSPRLCSQGGSPVAAGGDHLAQVRLEQRIGCQLGDRRGRPWSRSARCRGRAGARSSMVDRAGSSRANGSASRGSTSDIIVLTSSSRGSGPGCAALAARWPSVRGRAERWWRRRGAGTPGGPRGRVPWASRARPCGCGVPSSPCRHATTRAALSRTPPRPPPGPCPITVGGRRRRPARSWP